MAMIAMLLETLTGRQKVRAVTDEGEFLRLAVRLADGGEVDPDEAERVLAAAAKTPDDLKATVEVYTRRSVLKAALGGADGAAAEKERAEVEAAAVRAEFQAVKERYERDIARLVRRVQDLTRAQIDATAAGNELVRTCPDPDLNARRQALLDRRAAGEREAAEVREEVRMFDEVYLPERKKDLEYAKANFHPPAKRTALAGAIEKAEGIRAGWAAKLAEAQRAVAAIDAETQQVEAEMRDH